MDASLIEGFATLFMGRPEKYGYWDGADAWAVDANDDSWSNWRDEIVKGHLLGAAHFGVYPQLDEGLVRWGCSDFDDENALVHARNLRAGFAHLGVTAWVEVSRSKGYHVWVFADDWVPATTMRDAFLAVHQVLGIPAKEVNPKQILDGTNGVGNWVRLPYPGPLDRALRPVNSRQCIVSHDDIFMGLRDFVEPALAQRVSESELKHVAGLYKPPPPPEPIVWEPARADWMERLNKAASCAIKYGPREGFDRSNSLYRLAHECRDSGLTASEAFQAVQMMDMRPDMRKFIDRNNADAYYEKAVANAYG